MNNFGEVIRALFFDFYKDKHTNVDNPLNITFDERNTILFPDAWIKDAMVTPYSFEAVFDADMKEMRLFTSIIQSNFNGMRKIFYDYDGYRFIVDLHIKSMDTSPQDEKGTGIVVVYNCEAFISNLGIIKEK